MNARTLVCLTSVALSGCAVAIGFSPTNAPPHALAPRAPSTVEVHTIAPTGRAFVDIGLLEATIDTIGDDRQKVQNKLREAAAKRGCDGIVMDAGSAVVPVVGPSVDTIYRATCIVYRP